MFQLVSSRYEHASLILTSNLPFSSWGGVFGDQAVAAAMIDRIVHHADVLTLKGASYRLRNRGIDTLPSIKPRTRQTKNNRPVASFSPVTSASSSSVADMDSGRQCWKACWARARDAYHGRPLQILATHLPDCSSCAIRSFAHSRFDLDRLPGHA